MAAGAEDAEDFLNIIAADVLNDFLNYEISQEEIAACLVVMDDDDSSEDENADLLMLLLSLKDLEDTDVLREGIRKALTLLQSCTLNRPYEANFLTQDGGNRVNRDNWRQKFQGLFQSYFRFNEEELEPLARVLKIPEFPQFGHGYTSNQMESLLLTLHRLSSPGRYWDLALTYDITPQTMSAIFNGTIIHIYKECASVVVRSLDHAWIRSPQSLSGFASAIESAGCPLRDTVGFLDGTEIPIARPKIGQRAMYSGHTRTHVLKSLGIQFPNGVLIAFGPFDGCRHDSACAEGINLDRRLTDCLTIQGRSFKVYADSAFGIGGATITPFRSSQHQTDAEREWNREMAQNRIAVEWGFSIVKRTWGFLGNKKQMKCLASPVSMYWFCCVHLTNLRNCLSRNQVAAHFNLDSPSVEEYLQ